MAEPNQRRRQRGEDDDTDGDSSKRSASSAVTSLDLEVESPLALPLFFFHQSEEEEVTGGGGGGNGYHHHHQQQQQQLQEEVRAGRRLWVQDRSCEWWARCSDLSEPEFRAAFRMGRSTFAAICDALGAAIAKEDTALRAAIPVRQRVAVCVWRLATGEPLRLVSKRFGLGISTCHKLVLEVCAAIKTILMPRSIRWPSSSGGDEIKARFEEDTGIPGVVGAIYTTHIPIVAPSSSSNKNKSQVAAAAYLNKKSYSMTLQGVVSHDGTFTDVCIGWPGAMTDDQVFYRSALASGGAAADGSSSSWVVGGASFPLTDRVLVPYTRQNGMLTWAQHAFNDKLGNIQRVAEDAMARLKGRWALLQKRTEVKLQDLPVVVGACCVLHNICESSNDHIDPRLLYYDNHQTTTVPPEYAVRSDSARVARDDIAHNLLHTSTRRAGTNFF